MPINIYIYDSAERLDWLCNGVWDLPTQIDSLEIWLNTEGKTLEPNKYVADMALIYEKMQQAAVEF